MGNLKLVYAHPVRIPGQAANTVQVVKACSALKAAGCDTVLCIPLDRPFLNKWDEITKAYNPDCQFGLWRIPFDYLPAQSLVFGGLSALLTRLAARDVLMTRSITVASVAVAAGVPTVLELHSSIDTERPAVVRRFHDLAASGKLLLLVVISDALKSHFEARWPALAERILSAPLGGERVTAVGHTATLPSAHFNVGYVGQIYPGKGMEIVLPLALACPWADFHIVGGSERDIDHWRAKAGSARNLTFHGFVPHARTGSYLAAFDVVLAPYQRVVRGAGNNVANLADWMSPLKAFEYMAYGKAIMASDLPVLREILTHGETAILVPPDDVTAWIRALDALRDDVDLRARLGRGAKARMEHEFTRDAWARKVIGGIQSRFDLLTKI
jgi:glycosyltransferase involved in cell wall biosynthesis